MKCQVCGEESGKYILCRKCNQLKEQGLVIKCPKCNRWHHKNFDCQAECQQKNNAEMASDSEEESQQNGDENFLYEPKKTLVTEMEQKFYSAIEAAVPEGYRVFPQMNLAAFLMRTDGAHYQNELYRNIDFLITDPDYKPRVAVEVNDRTHLDKKRRDRDEKVHNILEEAGIPMITLWTSYGVNPDYIREKILEALTTSVTRVHHTHEEKIETHVQEQPTAYRQPIPFKPTQKKGCYIATCVYGSYDCPSVWVLRRYRDLTLGTTWYGKMLIKLYYSVSPTLVKWFGNVKFVKFFWKKCLDPLVKQLQAKGYADTPYDD